MSEFKLETNVDEPECVILCLDNDMKTTNVYGEPSQLDKIKNNSYRFKLIEPKDIKKRYS